MMDETTQIVIQLARLLAYAFEYIEHVGNVERLSAEDRSILKDYAEEARALRSRLQGALTPAGRALAEEEMDGRDNGTSGNGHAPSSADAARDSR